MHIFTHPFKSYSLDRFCAFFSRLLAFITGCIALALFINCRRSRSSDLHLNFGIFDRPCACFILLAVFDLLSIHCCFELAFVNCFSFAFISILLVYYRAWVRSSEVPIVFVDFARLLAISLLALSAQAFFVSLALFSLLC